jgi:hypothetical protein
MAYNFQLPIITDLTPDQQTVLNFPGAVAVSGGPGTGKSVIGLWRHIRNYDTGTKRSLLVTYTKSLERFLKETCRTINADAATNVDRTYRWSNNPSRGFTEIIVDEAQDVYRVFVNQFLILQTIIKFSFPIDVVKKWICRVSLITENLIFILTLETQEKSQDL